MARKRRTLPRIVKGASQATSSEYDGNVTAATIAVYSVKGGVGKTTLATNLAWCSAIEGRHPTLLWDLDASGGAGFLLGYDGGAPGKSRSAARLFSRDARPAELVHPTGIEGLELLPADETIRTLDAELLALGKKRRLAKLAAGLARTHERIVIDCPPVLNELSAQIVRAADLVVVPLPPSPLSARAFDLVVAQVAAHGRGHPPILPVFSMLDMRRTLHRTAREAQPDWPAIPYSSAAEQCAVKRRPLGAHAGNSPAAAAFSRLWQGIDAKIAALR